GLTIDATTGIISGTVGRRAAGIYTVLVTGYNGPVGVPLNRSVLFTWIVNDTTPPDLTKPADQINNDRTEGPRGPDVALDADSFSAVGLPPGLSIDPLSGVISGTIDARAGGTYGVTVTAYDGPPSAPVSSSVQFTWTVNDTTPPQLFQPPARNNFEN